MIRSILDRLYLYCGYLAAAFLVGIALSILVQIIGRLFGKAVDSTEASGFCMAASTFFGLAYTLRRRTHVRIDLLTNRMPARVRHVMTFVNCALGVAVVGFLSFYVWELALQSLDFHDVSPGLLAMPLWIPQAGAAFGSTVLAIAFLDELLWLIRGGPSRLEADKISDDQPVA